ELNLDPAAARRERLERAKPLHRLGGRRPQREGRARGAPGRRADRRGRPAARRAAHLAAAPGDPDLAAGARHRGPALGADQAFVAAQRAPLRRPAGQGQGGDAGGVRRAAVHDLAALLRRAPAPDRRRRRVRQLPRPALRRPPARGAAADRVPQGRPAPGPAVLVRPDRPRPARGSGHPGRRPRQLAPGDRETPRQHQRRRRGGPQHPHRHPARLRARRGPPARQPRRPLPRPRGRRRVHRGGQEPGQEV
ncbi:MAG: Phosphoglycerate mutase, partial [uncultured Friedmanniella sp.]